MKRKNFYIKLFVCIIFLFIFTVEFDNNNPITVYNPKTDYIKWFNFNVPSKVLNYCAKLDIDSINSTKKINWIDILTCLACKNGGDFNTFTPSQADEIVKKLKNGSSAYEASGNSELFNYYYDGYSAVLKNFIGYYKTNASGEYKLKYGVKAFSPIAEGYSYTHYRDFGASRSYGYKRQHLGNDLMGNTSTPIAAVEGGIIEAIGWNIYGGWRIGIRSTDSNRYYYYAHLKKDKPYAKNFKEGDYVAAGDIIGYLGMTGYSKTENTNNINIPHLHFGMQLIFDESQKDANSQIWIDVYDIIEFLHPYRVSIKKDENGNVTRKYDIIDPSAFE